MLTPTTSTSQTAPLGSVWLVGVRAADVNGDPVAPDVAATITVTGPEGQDVPAEDVTADVRSRTPVGLAVWLIELGTTDSYAGRYVATVTAAGHGSVAFTLHAAKTTPASAMPDLAAVKTYLRGSAASWNDDELVDALRAEQDGQRDRCRIPAAYPWSLRHALLRRVQRNLALRAVSLGYATTDADADGSGALVLPGSDAFVRDKEAPYRKRTVG